jgi:hypothetical protein
VALDHGRALYQGPVNGFQTGSSAMLLIAPEAAEDLPLLEDLLLEMGLRGHVRGDALEAEVPAEQARSLAAEINRTAMARGCVLVELQIRRRTLEEAYLELVAGASG